MSKRLLSLLAIQTAIGAAGYRQWDRPNRYKSPPLPESRTPKPVQLHKFNFGDGCVVEAKNKKAAIKKHRHLNEIVL